MRIQVKRTFLYILLLAGQVTFSFTSIHAQSNNFVYHTPYGKKYHTASCHAVDNTSNGILLEEAKERGLEPCSFCKPDENLGADAIRKPGPVVKPGQKEIATQCLGKTKEGLRCKRPTKNANGYCFQHLPPK